MDHRLQDSHVFREVANRSPLAGREPMSGLIIDENGKTAREQRSNCVPPCSCMIVVAMHRNDGATNLPVRHEHVRGNALPTGVDIAEQMLGARKVEAVEREVLRNRVVAVNR